MGGDKGVIIGKHCIAFIHVFFLIFLSLQIYHFVIFVCVCVRTFVNHVGNICHLELTNPLTKRTLLVIG